MFCHLLLLAGLALVAQGLPGGAPLSACNAFMPQHNASLEQDDPTNYTLVLNGTRGFPSDEFGLFYVPGKTYEIMIVGNNSETIRGFLVQGMTVTDSSAVGTFVDLPALVPGTTNVNARVGDCLPAASSATHMQPGNRTLREDFPYVALNWTAPPSQTGDVQFRFTVVQNFATWWADDQSAPVREGAAKITGVVALIASMIFLTVALM